MIEKFSISALHVSLTYLQRQSSPQHKGVLGHRAESVIMAEEAEAWVPEMCVKG